MPALIPTNFKAKIVWLGRVQAGGEGIRSVPLEEVAQASYAGFEGEIHAGLTRPSCVRTTTQFPEGTEIRNVRQFSILSAEEMAATAEAMGLERLEPEWVGASIVIEGIDDFTHVPPSSRLMNAAGTSLVIDMLNRPCIWPGKEVEKEKSGFGKLYKPAAKGRRGVTAWVEREGPLAVGDELVLHVPDQRVWAHLDSCLTASRPDLIECAKSARYLGGAERALLRLRAAREYLKKDEGWIALFPMRNASVSRRRKKRWKCRIRNLYTTADRV